MAMHEVESPMVLTPSPGSYAMFLPPDMSSVRLFRQELRKSLTENSFSNANIMQIELASDEALTNSISANVSCSSEETIICRWQIKGSKFTLYVVDYGSGIKEQTADDPNCFNSFLSSIKSHQSQKSDRLPYNGKSTKHNNMGKGLRIIRSLMDSVKIMFHGEGNVAETDIGFKVLGSILTLEYDRANH